MIVVYDWVRFSLITTNAILCVDMYGNGIIGHREAHASRHSLAQHYSGLKLITQGCGCHITYGRFSNVNHPVIFN